MPTYTLKDLRIVPILKASLSITPEGELRFDLIHGAESNHILTLRTDGTLRLNLLGESWAERAGIKTDAKGRILAC